MGFELLGVATICFIAYLYLPLALFRFGAEQYADLRRSPDSSPVETFIDAAIPSAALHSATWGLMWLIGTCPLVKPFVAPPSVDWRLIAAFVAGDDRAYVRSVISAIPVPTIAYFASLVIVSSMFGMMYGSSIVERLSGRTLADRAPSLPPDEWWGRGRAWRALTVGAYLLLFIRLVWFAVVEIVYATIWRVSSFLLPEQSVWLFRWSVRQPTVFVRTLGDRLYFGKFVSYEKTRGGKIESILLTNVWRYCYDDVKQTIADGRLPLSKFGGSLTVLWNEIADIHEADGAHLGGLTKRYLTEREIYLDGMLLKRFAGETVTAVEVYKGAAGGSHFGRDDIQSSLERLALSGVIEAYAYPDSPDRYEFPRRGPVATAQTEQEVEPDEKISAADRAYRSIVRLTVLRERRRLRRRAEDRPGDGNANTTIDTTQPARRAKPDV